MNSPTNPYTAGAPLGGERGFFGRQDTLDWVARELGNPMTNALILSGQRRIGKTSLLLQLERTMSTDRFLPVYFDLQDQTTCPLGQVLANLADAAAERVGSESLVPHDNFDNHGHLFRRVFLPQLYKSLGKHRRPVFLLDEFDVLDQTAEAELPDIVAGKALIRFLRRVMTKDRRSAFVFAVGRRAEDLSSNLVATFKTSLLREVWVLDRKAAETLVRQAESNDTLTFTDDAISRILDLTNCHPYLTQLLCQRIWEHAHITNPEELPQVDVLEVESAVSDALEMGGSALLWLWNGLSPAEKIYASAFAQVTQENEPISENRVIKILAENAARLRTRKIELAPRYLVKRRVLEKDEGGDYRFTVELLRRWVQQNRPIHDVKDELDRINEEADLLYKVGSKRFNDQNWQEATHYFQEALNENPQHFRARLDLGEALLNLGESDQAVIELEKAYELDQDEARSSLVRALIMQAQILDEQGKEDNALASCARILVISPEEGTAREIQSDIWTRRGDAAFEQNDWETALTAYREANNTEKFNQVERERRRQKLIALENETLDLLKQERYQEALNVINTTIELDPDHDMSSFVRTAQEGIARQKRASDLYIEGIHFADREEWEKAIVAFEAVLEETGDYEDTPAKLAMARHMARLSSILQEAKLYLDQEVFADSLRKLDTLEKLDSEYKRPAVTRLRQEALNGLYRQARFCLQEQHAEKVLAILAELKEYSPGYPGLHELELQVREQIRRDQQTHGESPHHPILRWAIYLAGIVGLLVIVTLVASSGIPALVSAPTPTDTPTPTITSTPTGTPTSTMTPIPTEPPTLTTAPPIPADIPTPTISPERVIPTVVPDAWGLHQVCVGQTLTEIASLYETTINNLVTINSLANPNLLPVGRLLLVPWHIEPIQAPSFDLYTVASDDTLSALAEEYSTNVAVLQAVNNLYDPNIIIPGTQLKIPGGLLTAVRTNECIEFTGIVDHPHGMNVFLRFSPAPDAAETSLVVVNNTPLQILGQNEGTRLGPWFKVLVKVTAGGYRIGWLRAAWIRLDSNVSIEDIPWIEQ